MEKTWSPCKSFLHASKADDVFGRLAAEGVVNAVARVFVGRADFRIRYMGLE